MPSLIFHAASPESRAIMNKIAIACIFGFVILRIMVFFFFKKEDEDEDRNIKSAMDEANEHLEDELKGSENNRK